MFGLLPLPKGGNMLAHFAVRNFERNHEGASEVLRTAPPLLKRFRQRDLAILCEYICQVVCA
jgi:hypothetical protein